MAGGAELARRDRRPHSDFSPHSVVTVAQHYVPVFISPTTTTPSSKMTSFIVEAHVDRPIHPEWIDVDNPHCVFCSILEHKLPAYKLYEDDKVIAILGRSPYDVELELGC